jgi:hypothetical protein
MIKSAYLEPTTINQSDINVRRKIQIVGLF